MDLVITLPIGMWIVAATVVTVLVGRDLRLWWRAR
jgi:hypothetical protein